MRLPLSMLEIFVAIAQAGSLRKAADNLGVKPSTVSHQLKNLEDMLGVALFLRTTRSLSLTEAGRILQRDALPAFGQLEHAIYATRDAGASPRGTLRIAMPELAYHLVLAKALPSFRASYPEIELELSMTDGLVNIAQGEQHGGIRLGNVLAEDMIAVQLTESLPLVVVASPDYLARNGSPQSPADLLAHDCVRYRYHSSRELADWIFRGPDGLMTINVASRLVVNSLPVMVDAAREGLGLVSIFADYVADDLASGALVSVLEDYTRNREGLYFYYPREYRDMVPLRLFRDHLVEQCHVTRDGKNPDSIV